MSRLFLCLIIALTCSGLSLAQTTVTGNFNARMYNIIDSLPPAGGNEFTVPDSASYQDWKEVITDLANLQYSSAETKANGLQYDLIELIDGTDTIYVLERQDPGPYWGTYALRPSGCRDVVIQSPHPRKDFNTGKQGAYVFKHSNAKWYFLAGTNRCNHDSFVSCSGTTSICGVSEPYRISDVAHNDSSIFQASTEAVHEYNDAFTFVQLHGFSKQPTDPYVIMSNGTDVTPAGPDYIDSLKTQLELVDDTLDFKIAHQDLSWTRLRGFSNTQGRYLNDGPDPCLTNADTTFGDFIHVEQEKTRLREDSTKWDIMATAVTNAFPCGTGSAQPPVNGIRETPAKQLLVYPNPFGSMIYFKVEKAGTAIIRDNAGRILLECSGKNEMETSTLPPGIYHYTIESNNTIYRGTVIKSLP